MTIWALHESKDHRAAGGGGVEVYAFCHKTNEVCTIPKIFMKSHSLDCGCGVLWLLKCCRCTVRRAGKGWYNETRGEGSWERFVSRKAKKKAGFLRKNKLS